VFVHAVSMNVQSSIRSDRAVMNALRMRYGEAHRHYHVWGHIESMLRMMEWQEAALFNKEAIEIAILFHDVVYEPGEADNEKRSAGLMMGMLSKIVAPVTLEVATDLILATEKHVLDESLKDPVRSDCAYFLDMDLAILGAAPDVFDAFEDAIRQEFIEVENTDYMRGRTAVLERFLARKRLYHTQAFHDEFEAQARINLQGAIAVLAG
jgi:predicted metal-dependent HD superfamily phosphohydrolase